MTQEQIQAVISNPNLQDLQMIEIIEQYIFDRTGVKPQIERPKDFGNIQLMLVAFDRAAQYYTKKFDNGNKDYKERIDV